MVKNLCKVFFCLALMFSVSLCAMAGGDDYHSYCRQMKEKKKCEFTIPEEKMEFFTEYLWPFLFFGKKCNDMFQAGFAFGPLVHLADDCKVIMMDIDSEPKLREGETLRNIDYDMPVPTNWLLNNCDILWSMKTINNVGGVILTPEIRKELEEKGLKLTLSPEERSALKREVVMLRSYYEHHIKDEELLKKTNSDSVYVVRIPHTDKLWIQDNESDTVIADFAKDTECYAVEFFKRSVHYHPVYASVRMLFFINNKSTSIDKCVKQVAEYICFE